MHLLDRLSQCVGEAFFVQNAFLILLSHPASRLSQLNYLSRRTSILVEDDKRKADGGMTLRGIAATLSDDMPLVKRNGLDLLLQVVKLDSRLFKSVYEVYSTLTSQGGRSA